METIIGLLGGLLASAVIYYVRKTSADFIVKKYGTVVSKAFEVLDPIAGDLMSGYNDSEVQQALKLVVTRVADSEIVAITNYVLAKFNPVLASAKVLDPESEAGKATKEIAKSVADLRDGASIEEIFTIAKYAKALF
jgi:hypothetical protein